MIICLDYDNFLMFFEVDLVELKKVPEGPPIRRNHGRKGLQFAEEDLEL